MNKKRVIALALTAAMVGTMTSGLTAFADEAEGLHLWRRYYVPF